MIALVILGVAALTVVFYCAIVLAAAGAIHSIWNWFLIPLGAPDVMSYQSAVGIVLMIHVLKALLESNDKNENKTSPKAEGQDLGKNLNWDLLTFPIAWGLAAVVHFIF